MPIWEWIILVALLIFVIRVLTRKRRKARKIRKANRKRARAHHGYQRTARTRGIRTPDSRCPECGLPRNLCRIKTQRAEHAEGMMGKKE